MTNHDLLETIADDLQAERAYADMLANPDSVVDAFDLFATYLDCPHRTAAIRPSCFGCTTGDPLVNQTGYRWCDDGQVVSVDEQETTCGCLLTDAEWASLRVESL